MKEAIFNQVTTEEWNEASSRVEAHLLAMHQVDRDRREKIIQQVLEKAALQKAQHPETSLTTLAMEQIRLEIEQWFGKVLAPCDRLPAKGLTSWYALDAAQKWPGIFLAEEIPADFQQALLQGEVCATPDLSYSSMVPQPYESSLQDINLPAPLGELAKELSPVMAKIFTFILSLAVWSSRPR